MAATVIWRGLVTFCRILAFTLCFRAKFFTQFQLGSSSTRNENQEAPWSDLHHDLLLLVMMRLGAFDFSAFGGVCKSWRSLAISNRRKFMVSKSPTYTTSLYIDANGNYYFKEGRFKFMIPHSAGRTCVGFTCGYLVFFGSKTRDFWLVNFITRHEFHFSNIPSLENDDPTRIRAFLVFSPSMSGWVFVMTDGSTNIWFSIAGQRAWNHVSSTSPVVDLHAFKGKMYTINNDRHFCELRLNPEPKFTLLETTNFPEFPSSQQLYSLPESLYVMRQLSDASYEFHKLDFDNMKWLLCERTSKELSFIRSELDNSAPTNPRKGKLFSSNFSHDFLID